MGLHQLDFMQDFGLTSLILVSLDKVSILFLCNTAVEAFWFPYLLKLRFGFELSGNWNYKIDLNFAKIFELEIRSFVFLTSKS